MDISLSCYTEDSAVIIKNAMAAIEECLGFIPNWSVTNIKETVKATAIGDENIEKLLALFETLIMQFPKLNFGASYSYDTREDDRSAQWFEVVTVTTQTRSDGTRYLEKTVSSCWS